MHTPLPSHAEKVFSGIRSEIYQWDQERYDGSIARFEKVHFLDGAFVVAVLPDGKILMTFQEQPSRHEPFFSLPGGAFDTPDESPLHCAKRELLEETGYESDEWQYWHTFEGTNNVESQTHFYIARNCRKSLEVIEDPGERILSLSFLDFDELLHMAEESRFVHWPLLRIFFGAILHEDHHRALYEIIYGTEK